MRYVRDDPVLGLGRRGGSKPKSRASRMRSGAGKLNSVCGTAARVVEKRDQLVRNPLVPLFIRQQSSSNCTQ